MKFLYYDAKGTDGQDPSKMEAAYDYEGQTVRIPGDTPEAQIEEAIFVALGLDPTEAKQRQAKLNAARAANIDPLDPSIADGKDAIIQLLVKKVAWLEQEILALRGGKGE